MDITEIPQDKFNETIRDVETSLSNMKKIADNCPTPVVLYTKDNRIAWCNKVMLNLFWGTLVVPSYTNPNSVFGKKIEDVMPDYLWPYVKEQNEKVFSTKASQYEEWSDEQWVSVKWRCLRFYVDKQHVAVILFPKDESHLAVCDSAVRISKNGPVD